MATWKTGDWIVGEWRPGRLELLRYVGQEQWVRVPERISDPAAIRMADDMREAVMQPLEGRVTVVGKGAFRSLGRLLGVVLPEGTLLIGAEAFENCRALQTVHLPESVRRIGERCFFGCESLETVWLPEGVNRIPVQAFAGCAGLGAINLQFVERIDAEAFAGCRMLGESCVNRAALHRDRLGDGAFQGCELLADDEGFAIIDDMLVGCFSQEEAVEVPDGIRVLDSGCFSDLPKLQEVRFSDSLQEIRSGIFARCPELKRVVAPGTVLRIGGSEFNEGIDSLCDGMLTFERDEIDWKPFSVEGPGSFLARELQRILPQNLYGMRFRLDDGEVTVLRYLGSSPQPRIPDVWKGYPVTQLGPYAFAGLEVERVALPKFLREIGVGAFAGDEKLRGVVMDGRLKRVAAYAFVNCTALAGAVFEEGLERVEDGAFAGCSDMRYALLPGTVAHIAPDAFEPKVLLAGAKDGYVQRFAEQNGREFLDAETDAGALAGRVVTDRYASYHMFVSGDNSGNNRWAIGGEVE